MRHDVQVSDWEARPLSGRQFKYACMDAAVLVLLYRHFEQSLPGFEVIVMNKKCNYSKAIPNSRSRHGDTERGRDGEDRGGGGGPSGGGDDKSRTPLRGTNGSDGAEQSDGERSRSQDESGGVALGSSNLVGGGGCAQRSSERLDGLLTRGASSSVTTLSPIHPEPVDQADLSDPSDLVGPGTTTCCCTSASNRQLGSFPIHTLNLSRQLPLVPNSAAVQLPLVHGGFNGPSSSGRDQWPSPGLALSMSPVMERSACLDDEEPGPSLIPRLIAARLGQLSLMAAFTRLCPSHLMSGEGICSRQSRLTNKHQCSVNPSEGSACHFHYCIKDTSRDSLGSACMHAFRF